ncbi:DUF222 domain-containing protein [Amycolatopsis marina]|uniref:DUF222 domain-containing protein n=1 Tax=Amycolatopsis marina TaxID=490629 RepID=UPI0015A52FDE|nr:DUF222 domain-containing protein [Amycolatopsis marina]
MSETDELLIPDWDINDLLDIPACSLNEREALEMVRSIGQVQSMLEAARLQAVQRLARLRSDDGWSVDLLATACKISLGRAGEDVVLAHTLSTRLPRTMTALAAGELDVTRVRQIDRATTPLSDEHALAVEERVFPAALHPMTDHEARRQRWETAAPITIGDNVWLGGGVIVCAGVTIGANTVVGAGSVVTRDLPERVFAAGNPCRVIRPL